MTIHPLPIPHVHGCPVHPLGEPGISDVSCRVIAADHGPVWHAAVNQLVLQATTDGAVIDVPPSTVTALESTQIA